MLWSSRPARAYYIDRLRAALTALVVCHHAVLSFDGSPGSVAAPWGSVVEYTTAQPQTPIFSRSISAMWFLNLNQLYFMGLFFFISGYFTPASFDRKGAWFFLKERFKRLAIPCVVYYFVIGPVLECWLMPHVITRKSKNKHWTIVEGPPWYLCTLVIFSCVYVACPHDIDRAAAAPSVGAFLLVGGLFMGVIEHAMSGARLLWLNPVTCYYSVQYVTWFAAGVYAYRQNWLETIVGYAPSTANFLRCIVVAFAGYLFFAIKALTYFGADNAPTTGSLEVLGAVWAVAVSLSLLHGFGQHNEKPSKLAKAACDAAYAVYVIHPIFLALAVWAYAGMLSAGHDVTQRIPASVTRGGADPQRPDLLRPEQRGRHGRRPAAQVRREVVLGRDLRRALRQRHGLARGLRPQAAARRARRALMRLREVNLTASRARLDAHREPRARAAHEPAAARGRRSPGRRPLRRRRGGFAARRRTGLPALPRPRALLLRRVLRGHRVVRVAREHLRWWCPRTLPSPSKPATSQPCGAG
jgi:peptidoglycan/LPS O-acetylase OafA/YrhL